VTDRGARVLLSLASVAVGFAAADTYVVVLALPDMMSSAGLSIDELQRAAPILSGFLLGYVAMLPLIGRIADLRGRLPVLVGSLAIFALGSLVTATAYDLPSMVAGRFLQGVGGGGLIPATLALVADMYPATRRGVPLGVVGAVQELGSVLGPLYGAVVLAVADWQAIFWINVALGLVLASAISRSRVSKSRLGTGEPTAREARGVDWVGLGLLALGLMALVLVLIEPDRLVSDVEIGLAFVPVAGSSRWFSPLGMAAPVFAALFFLRCFFSAWPVVDVRGWRAVAARADLPGAGLLALALSGVILAFATADPAVQVFSPIGPWLLLGSVVAAVLFWWRTRTFAHPLIPRGAFARTPAWGSLVVSLFVGAALIAALVDIPIFARVTIYTDSQLNAALVLVRFLAALPVGALIGGYLTHRLPAGVVTAAAMAMSAVGFVMMSRWGLDSLHQVSATIPLVLAGLGFGLTLAPVNASLLASTDDEVHGVTSALLVVARMVGMLVGISALTTIGLRSYYAKNSDLPGPSDVCPPGLTRCEQYTLMLREAGLTQLHVVFVGAAVCALAAGAAAVVTFRTAQTRDLPTAELLRPAG